MKKKSNEDLYLNDLKPEDYEAFECWLEDDGAELDDTSVSRFYDSYLGEYSSKVEFAEIRFAEAYPQYSDCPYIDYKSYAEDLFMWDDFIYLNGYVFKI